MAAEITLFICGDVVTGRGIDQILRHSCDPVLHEPYARDARRYVDIAEEVNGPIPRKVDDRYVWGARWLRETLDREGKELGTSVRGEETEVLPSG